MRYCHVQKMLISGKCGHKYCGFRNVRYPQGGINKHLPRKRT